MSRAGNKLVMEKIEPINAVSSTSTVGKLPAIKVSQDNAQEASVSKNKNEDELAEKRNRQRVDDDSRKTEEKNRAAKQLADDLAREQALKEAKAAKLAAEEAIKVAKAAKLEADLLAEKNRLLAKAEKEKADKEKAERERIEQEKAEKEKAIEARNQKDEDPIEAYRRSIGK